MQAGTLDEPPSPVETSAGVVARQTVYYSLAFLSGKILRFNKLAHYGAGIPNPGHGRGRGWCAGFSCIRVPPMNEVTRVLSAIEGGDPHAAALPMLGLLHVHQAEVRFMDERRRLERLAGLLLGQL